MGKSIVAASLLSAVSIALLAAPASAGESKVQPSTVDAANYQPKTEHDNTPYRFNMEQNGKRMTADEFDAWMKARGVHVATGKPAAPKGGAPVEQLADE